MDQPFDDSRSGWAVKLGRRIFPLRGLAGLPYLCLCLLLSRPGPWNWDMVWAGWSCLALGLFMRCWGVAGWYARGAQEQTSGLITTTGPYALTRNPRYLGNLALGMGACWLMGAPLCVFGFLLVWAAVHLPVIQAEEAVLSNRYGPLYQAYCRCVPRFMGRNRSGFSLWSRLAEVPWGLAWRAEKETWAGWLSLGVALQAYQRAYCGLSWLPWLFLGWSLVAALVWLAGRERA